MSDTAARSGNILSIPILVQRDQVLASRGMQKYHLIPDFKLFSHAKHVAIEVKGPLHITDDQMNVCQAFGADHQISRKERIASIWSCSVANPPSYRS